jgi:hypothetical protein
MGNCNHTELVSLDVVDDAVRKPAQRETAPVSPPWGTELRVRAKKAESTLELRDKSQPERGVGFQGVVDSPIG